MCLTLLSAPLMQYCTASSNVRTFLLVLCGIEPLRELDLKFVPLMVPDMKMEIEMFSDSSKYNASKKPFTANLEAQ